MESVSLKEQAQGQTLIEQKLVNGRLPEIQSFSGNKKSISEEDLTTLLLEIQQEFPCWTAIQKIDITSGVHIASLLGKEFFLKCSIWGYRPMTVSGITAFWRTSMSDILNSHSASEVKKETSHHSKSSKQQSWKTDRLADDSEIVLNLLKEGEGFLYLGFIVILQKQENARTVFDVMYVCSRLLFEMDRTLSKNLGLFFNPLAKDEMDHDLARHLRCLTKGAFVKEYAKLFE
eukprot:TRINITY_DN26324_c0_g1_i1.p1 TRINITY_DN26324_c0_g1~~TRINITY_DN26324_c0_g1_i1.p1  ORF type:complete len:259 (+),score=66.80 TRINITY_DN26324_c0_g1_i1:83-778(+)